ncbi:MAG: NAD(+) synthase, partial [Spirochaetaceae bacterium]|nr:NAD(+) synthase [Spirochaetaceae bacterium]
MTDKARELLKLDAEVEVQRVGERIRAAISRTLKRQGAVVAISGGIDSSVTAALCVQALGPDRVLGLMMPERDSSSDTADLSRLLADSLGIRNEFEEITPILDGVGCYRRRDEAYRSVLPEYGPGWKAKIVLPSVTETEGLRFFSLVALSPDGEEVRRRLDAHAYLQIVAATNFKQRVRKMLEYYHADRHNYAVMGTPNRLEYDQGFFVKLGDGAADVKPIAHLYKTQVYQLAEYLGVPEEICRRPPTTDTYSMPQSQEEFYFSLPYDQMDICLYGKNHGMTAEEVAPLVELKPEQV